MTSPTVPNRWAPIWWYGYLRKASCSTSTAGKRFWFSRMYEYVAGGTSLFTTAGENGIAANCLFTVWRMSLAFIWRSGARRA